MPCFNFNNSNFNKDNINQYNVVADVLKNSNGTSWKSLGTLLELVCMRKIKL